MTVGEQNFCHDKCICFSDTSMKLLCSHEKKAPTTKQYKKVQIINIVSFTLQCGEKLCSFNSFGCFNKA